MYVIAMSPRSSTPLPWALLKDGKVVDVYKEEGDAFDAIPSEVLRFAALDEASTIFKGRG